MTKFDLTTYDGRMEFIDYCKDNTELDAEWELKCCIEDIVNKLNEEIQSLEQYNHELDNEITNIANKKG